MQHFLCLELVFSKCADVLINRRIYTIGQKIDCILIAAIGHATVIHLQLVSLSWCSKPELLEIVIANHRSVFNSCIKIDCVLIDNG